MKRAFDNDFDLVPPSERFFIFKNLYEGFLNPIYHLKQNDDFFKKSSKEFSEEDRITYILYIRSLEDRIRTAEIIARENKRAAEIIASENKRAAEERIRAAEMIAKENERAAEDRIRAAEDRIREKEKLRSLRDKKISLSNNQELFNEVYREKLGKLKIKKEELFEILGFSIISFMTKNEELSEEKKSEIQNYCDKKFPKFGEATQFIYELFKIIVVDPRPRLPLTSSTGTPVPPSEVNCEHQVSAKLKNNNFIYGFPIKIHMKFSIYCCHSVFREFMDIFNENESSPAFCKYLKFIESNNAAGEKGLNFDKCIQKLIFVLLSEKSKSSDFTSEIQFVQEIVGALKSVFPKIKSQVLMFESALDENKFKLDGGIFIENFPFIIIEAKNMKFSINAVLQGLQYYGLIRTDFIDNNPCFLITIDHGIMFVYGIATVSRRIVCDCLLSFELTNYLSDVNNFLSKLYLCITGLHYFFVEFSNRVNEKKTKQDLQHEMYNKLKLRESHNEQAIPAIFDLKAWKSTERVSISYENVVFLSKNVFLVKTKFKEQEELAVLKICNNYNIKVHEILVEMNIAPRIIGHEYLSQKCQVILMEYLDPAQNFMSVHEYCSKSTKETQLQVMKLLNDLLTKIGCKRIIHGDFRSTNIFIKVISKIGDEDKIKDEKENVNSCDDVAIDDDVYIEDVSLADSDLSSTSTVELKLIDFEFSGMDGDKYPCLIMKNLEINWHPEFLSFAPRKFSHDKHMLEQMIKDFNV